MFLPTRRVWMVKLCDFRYAFYSHNRNPSWRKLFLATTPLLLSAFDEIQTDQDPQFSIAVVASHDGITGFACGNENLSIWLDSTCTYAIRAAQSFRFRFLTSTHCSRWWFDHRRGDFETWNILASPRERCTIEAHTAWLSELHVAQTQHSKSSFNNSSWK